jgi:uncharacterized membrane protein YqjE
MAMPPNCDPAGRAEFPAPRIALSLLGESLAHRAELAILELGEARDHALGSMLLAAAAAALLFSTGFAFTLLLTALVWDDPHRGWWLGGLAVAYLAAATAAGTALRYRLRRWRPLEEIRRQLQEDQRCLNQLLKSAAR